ncbi:MAG: aminomethyl-transferring glycine dehydrogenase subunit GcvPA [Candidatus Sericytochromatia bacterium]|nr:aminomethyl-transferring glycine dehydrogenase subunit GcvPA [Candidatus Tanganyikabacteria bacterium]
MPFNYLPLTDPQRREMLGAIGAGSMEDLLITIPRELRAGKLDVPSGRSEWEVQQHLAGLAARNRPLSQQRSFLGAGVSLRYRPAAVDHVASRSEFFTAYTPYQPEISQGTLQAIFEFQTLVCELTGMDVSNASMYDGSTATGEAALMCVRATRRRKVLVSGTLHPEYAQVVRTYAWGPGIEIVTVPQRDGGIDLAALDALLTGDVAGLIVQVPSAFGGLEPVDEVATRVKAAGALLAVVADPISLGLLEAPGRYGADICVGDGQALGNAMSFGGPHVGFMACKEPLLRQLPGRICGQTADSRGNTCYTLTLQTREQHIRREKAASNICTNQALNALFATLYLGLVGKEGLREVANVSLQRAHFLAERISQVPGFAPAFGIAFFNEFVVKTERPAEEIVRALEARGIVAGFPLSRWFPDLAHHLLVSVTEANSPDDLDAYVEALRSNHLAKVAV